LVGRHKYLPAYHPGIMPIGLARMWIRVDVLERLMAFSQAVSADSMGDAVRRLLDIAQESALVAK